MVDGHREGGWYPETRSVKRLEKQSRAKEPAAGGARRAEGQSTADGSG